MMSNWKKRKEKQLDNEKNNHYKNQEKKNRLNKEMDRRLATTRIMTGATMRMDKLKLAEHIVNTAQV